MVCPSDVPVTSFVCSVCFRLFVRLQALPDVLSGFYRRNSGLGFGDRSLGSGDCVAVAVGAEGSGVAVSFAVPVCVSCTAACSGTVARTSAVAEADVSVVSVSPAVLPSVTSMLSSSIPVDGINIFSRVIAEFLCRNRPYRDRGDGYSLRSGQVFDDRAVAADENFFEPVRRPGLRKA